MKSKLPHRRECSRNGSYRTMTSTIYALVLRHDHSVLIKKLFLLCSRFLWVSILLLVDRTLLNKKQKLDKFTTVMSNLNTLMIPVSYTLIVKYPPQICFESPEHL